MRVESSVEESLASSGSPGQPNNQETQPPEQVEAEGMQAWTPDDSVAVTAEEEQLLLESTALGDSPASDVSSMTGHMAALQVTTPPCEVTEDGDTSK